MDGIWRMLTIKADKPVEGGVVDILGHVKIAAEGMGVPCFLIGAKAIDLLLHNVYGFNTYRPTMDTDFAVALESWAKYNEFKIGARGFAAGTGSAEIVCLERPA